MKLILLLAMPGLLISQGLSPRANFGARLEPVDALLHGAGQSGDAFASYWSQMPAGNQPAVYMTYISLKGLTPAWADDLKTQLALYPNQFVIPQIGLSLTDGASGHYEQQVAAGDYDAQIDNLVAGLRKLATPVYMRIGYEFNGLTWNGYQPPSYKSAFIRITNRLRTPDLEVATVWDAAVDGVKNYLDYYPGDDYVDWFGMNIFSDSAFKDPSLPGFFAEARARSKPVMLGETTPRYVGAQGGSASWTGWYADFFDFLRVTPEVKQFNYINWDWPYWSKVTGQNWSDWGDARIETDAAAYVRNLYVARMTDPVMLHASDEATFRKRLGFADATPPDAVGDLTATPSSSGIDLSWTPLDDPSGIARYYIYRDSNLLDFAVTPPYRDLAAHLGTVTYTIAAMDRAGNLSSISADTPATLDKIERIANGGFEDGLANWRSQTFDPKASGSVTASPDNPIDGSLSARLIVNQGTGTNWHLQLRQFFPMTPGLRYTVRFLARASAPVSLPVVVQQVTAPNAIYLSPAVAITVETRSFEYTFVAPDAQVVAVAFYYGNLGSVTVWIDNVSVEESVPIP